MEPERIYERPKPTTGQEVFDAIRRNDVGRLLMIPIELGFHHENWKFIQDVSVKLSGHEDPGVRANALFGIEYAARFRGRVEKNIVKPVLLRALRDQDKDVAARAADTIESVNHLMGWNIGGASRQKTLERRFDRGRKRLSGSLAMVLLSVANAQTPRPPHPTQLGVAHIGGLYSFSETNYLNEGAAAAEEIGAKCIKVSLSLDTDNPSPKLYPFHSKWPAVEQLDALADTPYFRELFERGFETFILNAFRPGRPASYWREGFSAEDEKAEEECFALLARYLLRTYAQTQKTFIIQNWEGDWALRGSFDPATRPSPAATAAMIRWLSARQRGISRARAEFGTGGARVFHACEVNLVRQAQVENAPSVTTDVLPHVPVDLASYSAWDTKDSPARFAEALAFITKHKQVTEPYGKHGVYVGEFGLPESEATPRQAFERTAALLAEAQRFGCPYAVYWQVYCNEPTTKPPKVNADYKGFWLKRPDGTRSPVCELFHRTKSAEADPGK